MANATVEKLKALGLRHGEKAVVVLAALLCALFLVLAATKTTIDLTPEQVKKAAEAAASNLDREQKPDEILKRLENEFLKTPEFEEMVDKQAKTVLIADNYQLRQPWVTLEPGGGLLRDMPELITVSELYAHPGRGGILTYDLDEDGNRKPEEAKPVDETTKTRRVKKRTRRGAAKTDEEQKRQFEEHQKKIKSALVGQEASPKVAEKEGTAEAPGEQQRYKEITKGVRWVVLTGTIDHQKQREKYLGALKRPEIAHPHYERLDIERQYRNADGSWSDWEAVDSDENLRYLDNLPEEEEEWTPEDVRLEALVNPLPFLKAGSWEHVHIASLVPKEVKEVPKPVANERMVPGMSPGLMRSRMPSPRESMMKGMMGGNETTNFKTTESGTIMIRSLDFTVKPDTTYRYRVRIVVHNPNKDREDVNPGLDAKSALLNGPWSEPTEEVAMPADVTAYALQPSTTGKSGAIRFQVTRWDPTDGVTVVREFDAGPGEIVGETSTARIPSSEGKGATSRNVDFVSHQIVLDVSGGKRPLPPLGVRGADFEIPALSLLVRPDGSVIVRNSAWDSKDEVRREIKANYDKELAESGKKRESSYGENSIIMRKSGGRPPR